MAMAVAMAGLQLLALKTLQPESSWHIGVSGISVCQPG
jgi:hypothetical protein